MSSVAPGSSENSLPLGLAPLGPEFRRLTSDEIVVAEVDGQRREFLMPSGELLEILEIHEGWLEQGSPEYASRKADLSKCDLRGVYLPKHLLRKANLREARLEGAYLVEADFSAANLRDANLDDAILTQANFHEAKLWGTHLCDTDLRKVNFECAYLKGAKLKGARLHLATLKEANLEGARLTELDFHEVNLWGAKMKGANLEKANLQLADLTRADLHGANLEEADLQEANLTGADLVRAKLGNAKLMRANLTRVKFQEANLRGANLEEAKLDGADLTKAILQGCALPGADLQGAILNEVDLQLANLRAANLNLAKLGNANLQQAVFQECDMREAELEHANLQKAILRGARLAKANFREANLQGAVLRGVRGWRSVNKTDADLTWAEGVPADRDFFYFAQFVYGPVTVAINGFTLVNLVDEINPTWIRWAQAFDGLLLYYHQFLHMIIDPIVRWFEAFIRISLPSWSGDLFVFYSLFGASFLSAVRANPVRHAEKWSTRFWRRTRMLITSTSIWWSWPYVVGAFAWARIKNAPTRFEPHVRAARIFLLFTVGTFFLILVANRIFLHLEGQ